MQKTVKVIAFSLIYIETPKFISLRSPALETRNFNPSMSVPPSLISKNILALNISNNKPQTSTTTKHHNHHKHHNQRKQSTQPSSIIGCSLLNTCVFNFIAKSLDSLKLLVPFIALEGVRLMISCHHHAAKSIGTTAFSFELKKNVAESCGRWCILCLNYT